MESWSIPSYRQPVADDSVRLVVREASMRQEQTANTCRRQLAPSSHGNLPCLGMVRELFKRKLNASCQGQDLAKPGNLQTEFRAKPEVSRFPMQWRTSPLRITEGQDKI
ncbi:hypothetical protein FDECE_6207 [Fusarium decemcellulare]|nr:hypothetical protein FDECE_6207 [Fusarium decemcellulare]